MTTSSDDGALLDFRILGPLSVRRGEIELDLRGDRSRAVLALLLVRRNRVVPVATLADQIWGRDEDGDVRANLQVVVSQLRRTLAGSHQPTAVRGGDQSFIRTERPGYAIAVEDDRCDLVRFQRRRAAGNQARHDGRAAEAGRAFAAALAEWSGERALADLAGYGFADEFALVTGDEMLGVLAARIEADLACGLHHEVLGEISGLTRRYPLDHVLCGHLLIALTRCGRPADAADAYHRFRDRYALEMGANVPEPLRRIWGGLARGADQSDAYGTPTGAAVERTLVDDALSGLRAELVLGNGSRRAVNGRVTIGRAGCDILLPDPRVSKSHAVITPTPDGFVIADLGSTNRTFVGGEVVLVPRLLAHLDRIRLGDTELVFRDVSD